MIRVELPWPDKRLSPNARVHWSSRYRKTKTARGDARILAKAIMGRDGRPSWVDGDLHLTLVFCPPDRRRRDDDNCIASCKAYRDGIADALGVDDSAIRISSVRWVDPEKPGSVTFLIEPKGEQKND